MRKLLVNCGRRIFPIRLLSSKPNLTTIDINDKTGIAVLTLNRPPVNGLNLELLKSLNESLESIENDNCRGLILTSSSKTIFSAGLDISEMYKPDMQRLREFWTNLQDVWINLYKTNVPSAAAINGHSPAGGCLLATACEYRVMLPNFTIGLNETRLGIAAPKWFMASFLNILPRRVAELALTQGKMFTTDEAFKIGLIDEIASDQTDAINKCELFLSKFAEVEPVARGMTKYLFREKDFEQLQNDKEKDLDFFVSFITKPSVQKGLQMYMENLKKKSKK